MEFYTADNLAPTRTLKLSEGMLSYIASRINTGEALSLMLIAKEIQENLMATMLKVVYHQADRGYTLTSAYCVLV